MSCKGLMLNLVFWFAQCDAVSCAWFLKGVLRGSLSVLSSAVCVSSSFVFLWHQNVIASIEFSLLSSLQLLWCKYFLWWTKIIVHFFLLWVYGGENIWVSISVLGGKSRFRDPPQWCCFMSKALQSFLAELFFIVIYLDFKSYMSHRVLWDFSSWIIIIVTSSKSSVFWFIFIGKARYVSSFNP